MVVCVEAYAGRTGGPEGVKLEDQVLVTTDGCEVLTPFRFESGIARLGQVAKCDAGPRLPRLPELLHNKSTTLTESVAPKVFPMTYDPFKRGSHPVGVRSSTWQDSSRDQAIDVEIWYPATENHRGQDLENSTQDVFVVPGLSGGKRVPPPGKARYVMRRLRAAG